MDDFGSFSDFLEGLGKRALAKLPESIIPMGKTSEGKMLPLQLDEDYRLLIAGATPKYYGRNPVEVPDAAPGILQAGPGTNPVVMAININVVNVTASPVALTLWFDIDDPPSDYFIFGSCGGTVPANSYWQWQGELYMEGFYNIWGQAGAANALYAHVALRDSLGGHR